MAGATRSGLVAARKRKGYTQKSLAHALGVEPSTVGRWERATCDPHPSMWPRIAQELGITTDELAEALQSTIDGDHDVATTLKALLRQRHSQTYPTFKRLYEKTAKTIDSALVVTCPTKRQYYRWLNGQLLGLPHPGAQGVLEAMFPEYSAEQLFTPWKEQSSPASLDSGTPASPTPKIGIQKVTAVAVTRKPTEQRFLPNIIGRLSDTMLIPGRPSTGKVSDIGAESLALPELAARVNRAWQLRQQAAYGTLGAHLADLVPKVEASAVNLKISEQYAAHKLIVHTYNAASSLLKRLGDIELALIAADRALRAAIPVGDPLLTAAASYRLANVFLAASRLDDTREVAMCAAESVAPTRASSPLGLASWGGLLLTAAVASARMGDASGAWELLGEARAASQLLGIEYADIHTIFGPTNVAIHAVQVAAELGNGHDAVRRGQYVDADRLPPSLNERRGQYLIDLAHGYVLLGDDSIATTTLLRAEETAPEEVRFNPATHDMVDTMLERERVSSTPGLRGLAQRLGIDQ